MLVQINVDLSIKKDKSNMQNIDNNFGKFLAIARFDIAQETYPQIRCFVFH